MLTMFQLKQEGRGSLFDIFSKAFILNIKTYFSQKVVGSMKTAQ